MPPTPEGPSYIRFTGGPYEFGDVVTYEWHVGQKLTGNAKAVVALQCYQDRDGDGHIDTSMFGPDIVYAAPLEEPDGQIRVGGPLTTSAWDQTGGPAVMVAQLDIYDWKGKQQSITVLAETDPPMPIDRPPVTP